MWCLTRGKSKCLVFKAYVGRQQHMEHLPSTNFRIGGNLIEFVDSWPHLGHILNVNRDDGADMEKFVILCVVKLTTYCVILGMYFLF